MADVPGRKTLPAEVMVHIMECCDLRTLLNLRLLSKDTGDLIAAFEKTIVESLIRRKEPLFFKKIGGSATQSNSSLLLKRVQRFPLVLRLHRHCLVRLERYLSNHSANFDRFDKTKENKLLSKLENGYAFAWDMIEIHDSTRAKFKLNNATDKDSPQHALYEAITEAQVAKIKSASNTDLEDFLLQFKVRFDCFNGGDEQNWAREIVNQKKSLPQVDGQIIYPQKPDVEAWKTWCAINIDSPVSVLRWYDMTEREKDPWQVYEPPRCFQATVQRVARLHDLHSVTDSDMRSLQRSAKLLIGAIHKKVWDINWLEGSLRHTVHGHFVEGRYVEGPGKEILGLKRMWKRMGVLRNICVFNYSAEELDDTIHKNGKVQQNETVP